jgi:hypothetical protein
LSLLYVELRPLLLRLEALDGHLLLASIARPPDGSEKKKKLVYFADNYVESSFIFLSPALWISIVLIPIRIRLSTVMTI